MVVTRVLLLITIFVIDNMGVITWVREVMSSITCYWMGTITRANWDLLLITKRDNMGYEGCVGRYNGQ